MIKKIALVSSLTISLFSSESVYQTLCISCHNGSIAPKMRGVVRHLNINFTTKSEKKKHIVDFVFNPTKEKAICRSVRRFGLMPSLKGAITEKELNSVADYIIDNIQAGQGKRKCQKRF